MLAVFLMIWCCTVNICCKKGYLFMDYTYYEVFKHKGLLKLKNKNNKNPCFRLRYKHFLNFITTVTKSKI